MNILTTSKPKVQLFYMKFIFGRFYGLMLHHEVCIFFFSNYLHGLKEDLIAYGKHERLMKLIGDKSKYS